MKFVSRSTGKEPTFDELEYQNLLVHLQANAQRHSQYGPCDGLGEGGSCSECNKLMQPTELPPETPPPELPIKHKRIATVLEKIFLLCQSDDHYLKHFSESLEEMLNTLRGEDFFGTEGQSDPRGDFRDEEWSMEKVEGVDE